jgi:hypothetical protein
MDNIQKMIVGVLSVAGMIAMLVPSDDGVVAPPPAPAAPVGASAVETAPGEEVVTEESEISDEDVFSIGEPAIDGNPIGGQFGNSPDSSPPAAAQIYPQPDYGQSGTVTGTDFSQSYQAPPVN